MDNFQKYSRKNSEEIIMTYHIWGDTDFDWDSLDKAIRFISRFNYKYARLSIMMKEKYGTIRYECLFFSKYSIIRKYQKYMFRLSLRKAVTMFPCVKREIVDDYRYLI